jgi:hypothetical protein
VEDWGIMQPHADNLMTRGGYGVEMGWNLCSIAIDSIQFTVIIPTVIFFGFLIDACDSRTRGLSGDKVGSVEVGTRGLEDSRTRWQ